MVARGISTAEWILIKLITAIFHADFEGGQLRVSAGDKRMDAFPFIAQSTMLVSGASQSGESLTNFFGFVLFFGTNFSHL